MKKVSCLLLYLVYFNLKSIIPTMATSCPTIYASPLTTSFPLGINTSLYTNNQANITAMCYYLPMSNVTSLMDVQQLQLAKDVETVSFLRIEKQSLLEEYHYSEDVNIKHISNQQNPFPDSVHATYWKLYHATRGKILAQILIHVMNQIGERKLAIITDGSADHTLSNTLVKDLRMGGLFVDMHHLRMEDDISYEIQYNIQGIVIYKISFVFLLLTSYMLESVINIAEQNHIRTKRSTWMTLDSKELSLKYNCLHNIDMIGLMDMICAQDWLQHACSTANGSKSLSEIYGIDKENIEKASEIVTEEVLHCKKKGIVLQTATVFDPPMVVEIPADHTKPNKTNCIASKVCRIPISKDGAQWRRGCCSGLTLDILMEVASNLGFDIDLYIAPDGEYGGKTNGSWSGIIEEVRSRRADIGLQGLTIKSERFEVVDFTIEFLSSPISIVKAMGSSQLPIVNWVFLQSLELNLVIGLVVAFVTTTISIYALDNFTHFFFQNDFYYPKREAFSYIAGLTFQRDLAGIVPHNWSSRLIAIVYAIATTIIMTTYTANLTANNIAGNVIVNFENLIDKQIMEPSSDTKYGVMKGTSTESYFKNSFKPKYSKAYREFISEYLQTSDEEGMEKVASKELDAYIGEYIYLLHILLKPKFCSVLTITKESVDFPLAFAVAKNSPWKEKISREIRYLKETGFVDKTISKWYFQAECINSKSEVHEFPWQYIGGMFVAVGCVALLSVFIACGEMFHAKSKESMKKRVSSIPGQIQNVALMHNNMSKLI